MRSFSEKVDFLQRTFGKTKVARDGVNVAVKCPACNETKGKFSINVETWACHCWICGAKSKNLFFILKKYGKRASVDLFIKLFGLPEKAKNDTHEESVYVELPGDFVHLATSLSKDPDVRDTISYCYSRGLTKRDMWYFSIGTGISSKFRRRVIIPSFDGEGSLNYFVSRAIDDNRIPKYVNAPAKKTEIIFNEMNIDWSSELALVEGVFDMIKSGQNSTCLLGSKLSTRGRLFSKIITNKTPVLIALDKDMEMESHKIARSLSSYGCRVRILKNPTTRDAGDMTKKEFKIFSENSRVWSPEDKLRFKIMSLKSGSIL